MRSYFKHLATIVLSLSSVAAQAQIVVDDYAWPSVDRSYWPTIRWESAPFDKYGLESDEISRVDRMATNDDKMRALLVVKNGFLIFERYYHGGTIDQSTEVWSVTKSIVSALIGVMLQKKQLGDIDTRMSHYLSDYPDFDNITIRHALNHTTGLSWSEEGPEFVGWIASDDWVANALSRPRLHPPGEEFLYSSGNSHFLSALVHAATGKTPGQYADEHLFTPLGIRFRRSKGFEGRPSWEGFLVRTPHTWKQDPNGLEAGAFGLSMTAREMAKFGFLYLNKGAWNGQQIVSASWVEESTRDFHRRSDNFGFGYHWVVARRGGHLAFNADGWGGQIICIVPALDMVVVIKSDAENPGGHPYYEILDTIIEALAN